MRKIMIDIHLPFLYNSHRLWKINGEMSERFKEPVLKTGDTAMCRGFESHSLRQLFPKQSIRSGVVPKRPKGLPC